MSDPYGRTNIPVEPRKPKHFSFLRPIKYIIWFWFVWLHFQYCEAWTSRANTNGPAFFIALFIFLLFYFTPVLVGGSLLGLSGFWQVILLCFCFLTQIYAYFAFHLNNEEARRFWKNRLID